MTQGEITMSKYAEHTSIVVNKVSSETSEHTPQRSQSSTM